MFHLTFAMRVADWVVGIPIAKKDDMCLSV